MKRLLQIIGLLSILALMGCGEEYYSTPQKTLARYINSRMMMNREEYESCLNAFRKEDREWFEKHYMKLCVALYAQDCPGESLSTEVTVWTDVFEPYGPNKLNIESAQVDEKAGKAVLIVDGKQIAFVKNRGNWKIEGFFGARERLEEKYPQVRDGG